MCGRGVYGADLVVTVPDGDRIVLDSTGVYFVGEYCTVDYCTGMEGPVDRVVVVVAAADVGTGVGSAVVKVAGMKGPSIMKAGPDDPD